MLPPACGMTAASGPLFRNPALLVHHLSFLIYCLASHTRLLAPRFHAHALFPFSSSAGRFRHNSRLKLDRLRSLVQRQSFCLHEYITFPSFSRCWLPARLFAFLYIPRGTRQDGKMGPSLSSARRAVALQHDAQHIGRPGSLDSGEQDKSRNREPSVSSGANDQDNASDSGGF